MNIGEVDDIDSALFLNFVFKVELKSLLEFSFVSFSILHISHPDIMLCTLDRLVTLAYSTVLCNRCQSMFVIFFPILNVTKCTIYEWKVDVDPCPFG